MQNPLDDSSGKVRKDLKYQPIINDRQWGGQGSGRGI